MWVLGTKLPSSVRAAGALNCKAIVPAVALICKCGRIGNYDGGPAQPLGSIPPNLCKPALEAVLSCSNGKRLRALEMQFPELIFHAKSIPSFDIFMTCVHWSHMFVIMCKLKEYCDHFTVKNSALC